LQPSSYDPADPNALPSLLTAHYGALDGPAAMSVVAGHDTGDLHVAIYDFNPTNNKLWFSVGVVDSTFQFALDEWKACHRPFMEYNLADLWAGI
jgi:hypothetical protein